jgi:hypothetical protein
MWVELGAQHRIYQSMADAIARRRRNLEETVGSIACRYQQTYRRTLLRQRNVIAGFGQIVLKRPENHSQLPGFSDESQIDPRGEGF